MPAVYATHADPAPLPVSGPMHTFWRQDFRGLRGWNVPRGTDLG